MAAFMMMPLVASDLLVLTRAFIVCFPRGEKFFRRGEADERFVRCHNDSFKGE